MTRLVLKVDGTPKPVDLPVSESAFRSIMNNVCRRVDVGHNRIAAWTSGPIVRFIRDRGQAGYWLSVEDKEGRQFRHDEPVAPEDLRNAVAEIVV